MLLLLMMLLLLTCASRALETLKTKMAIVPPYIRVVEKVNRSHS